MAVDRIRQQRTPGQFGSDVTSLSDPNLSHANYSTPGVVDRSKGIGYAGIGIGAAGAGAALSGAIKLGQDVKEGFALADLESAQEGVINDYMESKKNPQIAADATIDAATLERTSQSLWHNLGNEGGASIEDIDSVEKHYMDKMSTLRRANDQGVMTPDEFTQRTLAVTREAINRNPSMYNDILAHSKKVLGLSGIESLLDAEKNAADAAGKQLQKRIDAAMQISKENNIPHRYTSTGDFDLAYAETQNAIVQQEKFGAESIARMQDYQSNKEKLEAADYIRGPMGVHAINGLINQANDFILGVMRNPENKTDQLTVARQMYDGLKRHLAEVAGPLMHLPGVKDQLDYANKTADASLSTFEKFSTKEDQVKYLEGQSSIMRNVDYQKVASQVSPAALNIITQIMSGQGAARILNENPKVMGGIMTTLGNIMSGAVNGLGTDYGLRDGTGGNAVSNAINLMADNATKGDKSSSTLLGQSIETVWSDIKGNKFATTEDKYKFYDSYIKAMGNQAGKDGYKGLSDAARGKASENLEEYMQLTLGGLKKDIASMTGRGTEIKIKALPDGRLDFQTTNPADTDMLLKKYGIRINDSLRAFANLTGTDTKKAAEALYPQYDVLKDINITKTKSAEDSKGDGRPNETNPLNLTIPGKVGKFQSFDNVEEGIRAASVQLDRYFTGKTTGKALQTVSDIAGLWNNEHEKGSASKKDYVAAIVKHSGLDPNAQLDLTDPSVKADLIYGMAIAEGRKLRPSQILAALGKM